MVPPLCRRTRIRLWGSLCGLVVVLCGCAGGDPAGDGEGRRIYAERCAACHGEGGVGDGPTAGLMGITPANLQVAVREKSKADVLGTIARGRGVMPAFGRSLTEAEREAVYRYIGTLPGNTAAVSRGLDPTGARGLR